MKTWQNKDKSKWKDGEWTNEPDKAQWIDEDTGLDCLIVRGPMGALCGYVGVPESSKYFEKEYEEVDVDVHGGLTFADKCRPSDDESKGVCHIEEGAANETVWWLGFDCAHAWDYSPSYSSREDGDDVFRQGHDEVYRDFGYVKLEVKRLAKQLEES